MELYIKVSIISAVSESLELIIALICPFSFLQFMISFYFCCPTSVPYVSKSLQCDCMVTIFYCFISAFL